MSNEELTGNIKGLSPSEKKELLRLYRRPRQDELVSHDLARELYTLGASLRRRLGLLISRKGGVEAVFVGTKDILYLPELSRMRAGEGRLRGLRLIYTDLSHGDEVKIPQDILTDLEKLRLDAVCGVKELPGGLYTSWAHIVVAQEVTVRSINQEKNIRGVPDFDFSVFATELESELGRIVNPSKGKVVARKTRAYLVGVYDKRVRFYQESFDELVELARSAGVEIAGKTVQRRTPDERTLLGKGKLEEVVLECLRCEAEMLIFDGELTPSQWRSITNQTSLKVIDRSMLILDIFAQRATSSDGRVQVELAQLKYTLPRLVEKDTGLSRLSGGIGGRGPGETKLEISRRRVRDKITDLEERITGLSAERALKRQRREESKIPLISIVGYTNVGKSTLFNRLTSSQVIVENKLFATLDTSQRKLFIPARTEHELPLRTVLSDTVGFIRELPEELSNAFRATLEEVTFARILIHVLDASDPNLPRRVEAVYAVLTDLEVMDTPCITVLNKKDQVSPEVLKSLCEQYDAIAVSALSGEGCDEVLGKIRSVLTSS
jgi:GTP-binding protein HflX